MNLCHTCCKLVHGSTKDALSEKSSEVSPCFVCLGLWQGPNAKEQFVQQLSQAIQIAAKPYGGVELNRFVSNSSYINMNEHPRIVLPGDLVYRYKLALQTTADRTIHTATRIGVFADQVKKFGADCLMECIEGLAQKPLKEMQAEYPDDVTREEQGYLGIHIVVTLDPSLPRPVDLLPSTEHPMNGKRSRRQRQQLDISQGGDPRVHLEERVEKSCATRIWTVNQALAASSQSSRHDSGIQETLPLNILPPGLHVAIWRRPFCLSANYTKSRRDVSQTPFFVSGREARGSGSADGPVAKKRRLGVTSVEEQILPAIEQHVGGISTHNEQNTPMENGKRFGMIKFHASGREDMDVRMMLPRQVPDGKTITGRPFVCEVTDALRLPSLDDLSQIVATINQMTDDSTIITGQSSNKDVSRSYGRNPLGVDISPDLCFVQASAYSNLQAETEEKIKYYACYCWSQNSFTSIEFLRERLQRHTFPLEIKQKTPIRVLHRRVNMTRTRRVLSCHADRIDDHNFILHISTDAGTYVKEWCHGDLGRTTPSLSNLLGCKADILQLDCEGIGLS